MMTNINDMCILIVLPEFDDSKNACNSSLTKREVLDELVKKCIQTLFYEIISN